VPGIHVAVYDGEVVGYYWLIAQSHLAGMFSSELESKFERIVFAPCIYLGMLAVRWDLQGNKIGYALMMHAFGQTLKAAEHVGVYALTLEAINESKAQTYTKWNFQRFVDGQLHMYIPLATIRSVLGVS
jgi:GNAT superfamily N-acetyltransferase